MAISKMTIANVRFVLEKFLEETRTIEKVIKNFGILDDRVGKNIVLKVETILHGLSENGFTDVTFSLPFLYFSIFEDIYEYPFLILSGIKKNGSEKRYDDPLMDDLERHLFEYEKKMADCIDDDFKVDVYRAEEFLKTLIEYSTYYYQNANLEFDETMVYSQFLKVFVFVMTVNIVGTNFLRDYEWENYKEMYAEYFVVREEFLGKLTATEELLERAMQLISAFKDVNFDAVNIDLMRVLVNGKDKFQFSDEILRFYKDFINGRIITQKDNKIANVRQILYNYKTDYKTLPECVCELNAMKGSNIPEDIDSLEFLASLKILLEIETDSKQDYIDLVNSLSKKGVKKPSVNLPVITHIDNLYSDDIEGVFLVITGIKKNVSCNFISSERTKSKPFLNSYKDFNLKLSSLIEGDYSIKRYNITHFVNVFMEFLLTQNDLARGDRETKDAHDKFAEQLLLKTILYIIYKDLGVLFSKKSINSIKLLVNSYLEYECFTYGGIANIVCSRIFKQYEMLREKIEREKEDASIKETVESIFEYVHDGEIVRSCPLDEFFGLLRDSSIPEQEQEKYYEMMRERIAHEEYENRLAFCKEAVFTHEEATLYEKYSGNEDAKDIISSIDSIIELFLEASDEDKLILFDAVGEEFAKLREIEEKRQAVLAKIVYFSREVKIGQEISRIPMVLESSLRDAKCDKKIVLKHLERIVDGCLEGDGKIEIEAEPYQIYFKGKSTQIFYARIEDIIVVIDGGRGKVDSVLKVVASVEFRRFYSELVKRIQSGQTPSTEEYTTLIIEKLSEEEKRLSLN